MPMTYPLLADYNAWFNKNLYTAASALPQHALSEPAGAFFGSIIGTLNHILVGDIIWLKRFALHPASFPALQHLLTVERPASLDAQLFDTLTELWEARTALDKTITAFASEITQKDAEVALTYHDTKGVAATRVFGDLVLHLFNHQTHHRGQVTTLLHQRGVDVGTTDLLIRIPTLD